MKIHTKKMLSYLAVGMILSQAFSLVSSGTEWTEVRVDTPSWVSEQEIISDEIDLTAAPGTEPEIISDEVNLLEEIVLVSPIPVSKTAKEMATDMTEQELLRLFIENKSRLQWVGNDEYNYDDFIEAWRTLTTDYNSKSEADKLMQKEVFLEIFLQLTQ